MVLKVKGFEGLESHEGSKSPNQTSDTILIVEKVELDLTLVISSLPESVFLLWFRNCF
jgi:hypothetical protein